MTYKTSVTYLSFSVPKIEAKYSAIVTGSSTGPSELVKLLYSDAGYVEKDHTLNAQQE